MSRFLISDVGKEEKFTAGSSPAFVSPARLCARQKVDASWPDFAVGQSPEPAGQNGECDLFIVYLCATQEGTSLT